MVKPYEDYPKCIEVDHGWDYSHFPWRNLVQLNGEPYGRIIEGHTLAGLLEKIDESERLLTALELVEIRKCLYRLLCKQVPETPRTAINRQHQVNDYDGSEREFNVKEANVVGAVMETIHRQKLQYLPWVQDTMTDTYMVTHQGKVFVGHGDFFDTRAQQVEVFKGEVKDGGITCPPETIERIVQSVSVSSFPVDDYASNARGGTLSARHFATHPHTIAVIGAGNEKFAAEYIDVLRNLAMIVSLSRDRFATWQTARGEGQMRMVCLGGVGNPGEAIYPRNASTVGCESIAIQKTMNVPQFLARKESELK